MSGERRRGHACRDPAWGRTKTGDPPPLAVRRRALVAADERDAYYGAQRRATHARMRNDRAEFYHWAEVAAEIARIALLAEMDIELLRTIMAEEERRAG